MFSSTQIENGFSFTQLVDPTTPSSARTQIRDSQGLVPVTVKQISEASQSGDEKSNFMINGVDVTNVTVVGMVADKTEKVTDVSFTLDDGTGLIGCRRWVNESFDTAEMEAIMDGMYVRVNGHLKAFQGARQLVAFSVRPVTNFDELTFHFIDCIYSHLQNSKLQVGASTQAQMMESSSLNTPVRVASSGYQKPTLNQLSSQYSVDGLKDCDQLILDCLRQSSNIGLEKGVHMDDVSNQLKLPKEKIRESIRSLEDEGLIYSTIDEFHYKAT